MNFWIFLSLSYNLITPLTACGSYSSLPTLALSTSTVTHSQSDGPLHAKILSQGSWSAWKKLDNPACNDFESGNTDFFNNFNDITSKWDAVALYNCETNGWALNDLAYYNGATMSWITNFCGNIGGPGKSCGISQVVHAYCGSDTTIPKYSAFWVDQNDKTCPLVVIDAGAQKSGYLLTSSDPGIPSC